MPPRIVSRIWDQSHSFQVSSDRLPAILLEPVPRQTLARRSPEPVARQCLPKNKEKTEQHHQHHQHHQHQQPRPRPASFRQLRAASCWLIAASCCWPLAASCQRLAAGYQFLAACCWLLAASCWLLAASG